MLPDALSDPGTKDLRCKESQAEEYTHRMLAHRHDGEKGTVMSEDERRAMIEDLKRKVDMLNDEQTLDVLMFLFKLMDE